MPTIVPQSSDYKDRPKQSIYAQPRSISYRLPIDPTQVLASSCTVSITTAVRYLYQYTGIRYQYIRYQYILPQYGYACVRAAQICMLARAALVRYRYLPRSSYTSALSTGIHWYHWYPGLQYLMLYRFGSSYMCTLIYWQYTVLVSIPVVATVPVLLYRYSCTVLYSANVHAGARSALPKFSSIFNCGGHKSIKNNRSMHSPDRLGIDQLCIAPIDYLRVDLIIATLPKYGTTSKVVVSDQMVISQHLASQQKLRNLDLGSLVFLSCVLSQGQAKLPDGSGQEFLLVPNSQ